MWGTCGGSSATCNCPPPPPPAAVRGVAELKLRPFIVYRHIHDPVTVTAMAFGADGLPVANATVAFAVYGECQNINDGMVKTADANGFVEVTLTSVAPGAVIVVAAAVNDQRVAVLSDPVRVFFVDDYSNYVREKEREDDSFGEEYDGR